MPAAGIEAWRTFLLPSAQELAYRRIPWHARLIDGIEAARRQQRPMMLWAMNGHPLGCT